MDYIQFYLTTRYFHSWEQGSVSRSKCSSSGFQGSSSFVPVFIGCVNVAKRGRRSGGKRERAREKKNIHWSAQYCPYSVLCMLPITPKNLRAQIPDRIVWSDQVTCVGRPASLQTHTLSIAPFSAARPERTGAYRLVGDRLSAYGNWFCVADMGSSK